MISDMQFLDSVETERKKCQRKSKSTIRDKENGMIIFQKFFN